MIGTTVDEGWAAGGSYLQATSPLAVPAAGVEGPPLESSGGRRSRGAPGVAAGAGGQILLPPSRGGAQREGEASGGRAEGGGGESGVFARVPGRSPRRLRCPARLETAAGTPTTSARTDPTGTGTGGACGSGLGPACGGGPWSKVASPPRRPSARPSLTESPEATQVSGPRGVASARHASGRPVGGAGRSAPRTPGCLPDP